MYSCHASNEAGHAKKYINVVVQPKHGDVGNGTADKYKIEKQSVANAEMTAKNACKAFPRNENIRVEERIILGDIADQGEFPWMAAIFYSDELNLNFGCGGTIISEFYIMTAAHCVTDRQPPVIVRLGKVNLTDTISDAVKAVHYNIKNYTRHPNYNITTKKNDIGLIRLSTNIRFTNAIRPACLHTNMADVDTNRKVIVIGWGNTDPARTSLSNELRKIEINTKPLNDCNNTYLNHFALKNHAVFKDGLIPGQYCAYDPKWRMDSCQGDSGGSLQKMSNNDPNTVEIVAIVSFAHGCALELPSIYTRVAHYIDWITPIVWPQN
ncbi:serine protease persephone-like [Contarinia nasturtii]|uniref:serine protease persephone-like n=1 Tax=Contarinia nasturtii TaxID=265458 RepID=UPI0012D3AB57|nr:serine protease persephone-like [Contarinia nasturtii]